MSNAPFQTVYVYDPITGEFNYPYQAQLDPMEPGNYITPVDSTSKQPPTVGSNQVAVFGAGAWFLQPDYRGQTIYSQTDGTSQEVTTIGSIPSGFVLTAPPPTLDTVKTDQALKINQTCLAAIVAGFTSSALGTPHTYPSKMEDQQNLAANVLSSTLPNGQATGWTTPQICATQDPIPVWAYLDHDVAQIQQVGEDGKASILSYRVHNQTLQNQIIQATTVAKVEAILW
jgi:hypothetical protein